MGLYVYANNIRFDGVPRSKGGILIDFDKDSRTKRNKAYEKSRRGIGR